MKKLFTLFAFVATIAIFAQAPKGFNYQATVRNSSGALITNQNVYFKFNVMLNSATSVPVYSETHYVPTDDLGQVNCTIGQGTASTGTFATINWGTGNYYLGIEINTGNGYVPMGTTQLLSVPYALYANSSGNSNFNFPNGTNIGDTLNWIWNGSAWVPTSTIATAQLPVISTIVATNILTLSPSSGGTITSDGGYSITSKGVCWSTSPNPTINNSNTNNGTGASNFTSVLSNLLPATTYYYRAYATNSIGTTYGITYTFTTADIPKIITTVASSITSSAANSGGTISSDGGATITAKGVCWSTSPNPTVALTTQTSEGTGTATFTSNIYGLTLATTYYVRAYATNSIGTAYGTQITFTTALPTLTTVAVQSITATSAVSGGNITSEGGATITAKGVCWSTSPNPTLVLTTQTSNGTGTATFTSNITGLTPGITYYVRAYATNSIGTAYGAEITFAAAFDGTGTGTQVWATKNLDVTTYRDGTPIPEVKDVTAWKNLTTGAWCYYQNNTANGTTYGKLYNWYAVVGIHDNDDNTPNKILAPTGWHVPADAEWTTLTTFLGGESVAGGKMKATGTSLWTTNTDASNSSGFGGLPGGCRLDDGTFGDVGSHGYWWSSSEIDPTNAWTSVLYHYYGNAYRYGHNKRFGFSVRCLKD